MAIIPITIILFIVNVVTAIHSFSHGVLLSLKSILWQEIFNHLEISFSRREDLRDKLAI
jgi:hypothetical protein